MEKKHREACDACHNRKIRCPSGRPGACSNCQSSGRVCAYSLRDEMGRPKKTSKRKERDKTSTRQVCSSAQSPARTPSQEQQQLPQPQQPSPGPEKEIWSMLHQQQDVLTTDEDYEAFSMPDWQGDSSFPAEGFDLSLDSPTVSSPSYTPDSNNFTPLPPDMTPRLPSPGHTTPESFQHQQKPHALEDWIRISVKNWTPYPERQTVPYTSHLRLDSMQSGEGNFTLDVYRYLTRILFDLRLECGREWSPQDTETSRPVGVFRSVSSLCDVVQSVLTLRNDLNIRSWPNDEESNITVMLTFTAIPMVLDIYKSLSRIYTGSAEKETSRYPSRATVHPCFDAESTSQRQQQQQEQEQQSCSPRRLNNIVQLTIMDFHLARLQRVFGRLDATESFQALMAGTSGHETANIQQLRESLQGSIETLKSDL